MFDPFENDLSGETLDRAIISTALENLKTGTGHYKLQLQLALDLNKAEYVHTAIHKVCIFTIDRAIISTGLYLTSGTWSQ